VNVKFLRRQTRQPVCHTVLRHCYCMYVKRAMKATSYKTIDVRQPISGSLSNVHVVSRLAVEVKVDGEEEHTEHKLSLIVNNSRIIHTDFLPRQCDEQSRG